MRDRPVTAVNSALLARSISRATVSINESLSRMATSVNIFEEVLADIFSHRTDAIFVMDATPDL